MITDKQKPNTERLRAIVEIISGEVIVFPVADSDSEREEILGALRVYFGEAEGQSRK